MLFITAEVETEQGGSSLDQKQGYSSNFYVTALFLTQQSSRDQSIGFVHDLLAGLLQSSRTPPSSMASSSIRVDVTISARIHVPLYSVHTQPVCQPNQIDCLQVKVDVP